MTNKRITRRGVDRVLSAIEEDILRASDAEILQETHNAHRQANGVRALVERQIQARTQAVPREPAARRQLLAELLRARPTLAPEMSATFNGGQTPSDNEVDEVISLLLRRGVLNPKND